MYQVVLILCCLVYLAATICIIHHHLFQHNTSPLSSLHPPSHSPPHCIHHYISIHLLGHTPHLPCLTFTSSPFTSPLPFTSYLISYFTLFPLTSHPFLYHYSPHSSFTSHSHTFHFIPAYINYCTQPHPTPHTLAFTPHFTP